MVSTSDLLNWNFRVSCQQEILCSLTSEWPCSLTTRMLKRPAPHRWKLCPLLRRLFLLQTSSFQQSGSMKMALYLGLALTHKGKRNGAEHHSPFTQVIWRASHTWDPHGPTTAPEAESVQVWLDMTVNYLLKCCPGGTSGRRTCLPMQET